MTFVWKMKPGIQNTIIFCLTANCRNLLWMAKVTLTFKSSAMKSYLPFLSLALIFASCSTAYKSGQTPDDVYFSPARPQAEYARVQENDDRQYRGDEEYRDDRYLRMKVRNRRWSTLDDGYSYNYYPSNPYLYNSSWSAMNYWNVLYNPYCCCNTVIINNPKSPVYNKPRMVNLRVFDNLPASTSTNPKARNSYNTRTSSRNNNNYQNSGTNAGSFLRNVFGSSGSSSNSTSPSTNSKTYSGSSSGSSSSGSSSSGGSSESRGNATRGRN